MTECEAIEEALAIQDLRLVCGGDNERFKERMARARLHFESNFKRAIYMSLADCIRAEIDLERKG